MTTFEEIPVALPGSEQGSVLSEIEEIRLPSGEVRSSNFLVLDGSMRAWLRSSVHSGDMSEKQAEDIYKRWNPDPEFQASQLFL